MGCGRPDTHDGKLERRDFQLGENYLDGSTFSFRRDDSWQVRLKREKKKGNNLCYVIIQEQPVALITGTK